MLWKLLYAIPEALYLPVDAIFIYVSPNTPKAMDSPPDAEPVTPASVETENNFIYKYITLEASMSASLMITNDAKLAITLP